MVHLARGRGSFYMHSRAPAGGSRTSPHPPPPTASCSRSWSCGPAYRTSGRPLRGRSFCRPGSRASRRGQGRSRWSCAG
eukprot:scaffold871_cov340-Prasinococcus_capsulatus_cf.AAC.4